MRILLTAILVFGSFLFVNAQYKIALYNPTGKSTKIFSSLDTAYFYAQSGDNIYLPGGKFKLSTPISKCIHIYGAGSNQDSSGVTGVTFIDTLRIVAGADNGSIDGIAFVVNSNAYYNNYPSILFDMSNSANSVTNFTISSCYITEGIYFTASSSGLNCTSFILRNNILVGEVQALNGQLSNSLISNNLIKSNCWIESGNLFYNNFFTPHSYYSLSSNCTYQNNIFPDISSGIANAGQSGNWGGTNSIYNYNINASPTFSIGNSGTGNITADLTSVFSNYNSLDYHIPQTSVGYNSGMDGTDIGFYGGLYPWKDGAIPSNPHISLKQVNLKTNANGTLNATFQVTPQSY